MRALAIGVLLLLASAPLFPDGAADAEALYRQAVGLFNQGRTDAAAPVVQQALSLFEKAGRKSRQVDALSLLGLIEYYRAAYPAAEKRFQEALDIAHAEGLEARVPGVLNNLGLLRYAQGRYEEALGLYRSAWEALASAGDTEAAAQSLGNIASVSMSLARYADAEKYYGEALDAFLKAGDRANAANTRLNLGILYTAWGKNAEARAALEQGLEEARALGLRQSEAYGLASLAGVQFAMGQYDRAEEAYLKALQIDTELNLRLNVIAVTSGLGMVYQAWGRTDLALDSYRKALADAQALGVPDQVVSASYLIGSAFQADGKLDAALAQFAEALEQARAIGHEPAELPILESMGTASFLKHDTSGAEPWFRKAYDLAVRLDQPAMAARQLIHLGAVNETAGNRAAALQMYTMALDRCRAAGSRAEEATALNDLGTLALDMGDFGAAESRFLEAISVKEELRRTATGAARMDFLATQLSSYRWLITARILKGDPAGAFDASELTKVRWLAEELGSRAEAAPDAFTGIRAFQPGMAEKALVVTFAGVDGPRPAVIAASRRSISAREIPPLAGDGTPVSPAGAEDRQEKPSRGFTIVSAPPEPNSLAEMVRQYRRLLARESSSPEQAAERRRRGRELYDLLLGPVADSLEAADELLVIPDGALCALPFEALVLPDGRWLAERFHVTYAPSLTSGQLLAARRSTETPGPGVGGLGKVLALGGVQYQAGLVGRGSREAPRISPSQLASLRLAAEELRSENRSVQEIYDALGLDSWEYLPATRAEVAAIAALVPGTTVLAGPDASKTAIQRMSREGTLAGFSVLHFATHAFAVPAAPDLSALVLAAGDSGSRDGYLTAREVAGLKLGARFVNLSACETGLGRILAGEGVVGLSEAFLVAGADSLSVSLWPISDEGTRAFMTDLYRLVKERGMSFARAMTEVKRAFIREGRYAEPFFWAPFVYYGL